MALTVSYAVLLVSAIILIAFRIDLRRSCVLFLCGCRFENSEFKFGGGVSS